MKQSKNGTRPSLRELVASIVFLLAASAAYTNCQWQENQCISVPDCGWGTTWDNAGPSTYSCWEEVTSNEACCGCEKFTVTCHAPLNTWTQQLVWQTYHNPGSCTNGHCREPIL